MEKDAAFSIALISLYKITTKLNLGVTFSNSEDFWDFSCSARDKVNGLIT